jgi:hypothetical protein
MFVGVRRVTIGKKWNIEAACARAAAGLPAAYYNNLKAD